MISHFSGLLLLLLLVLTFLGGIIGYCIALIVVKKSVREAIETSRLELALERQASDAVLEKTRTSFESNDQPDEPIYDRAASERERVLIEKNKDQEHLIQSMEVQVATLEDQHERFQRHFAGYKAEKQRELASARNALVANDDTDDLPTLSRKVDPATGRVADAPSLHIRTRHSVMESQPEYGRLERPLSSELDIPALEELELPESASDLEFDLADEEQAGTKQGG